MYTGSIVSRYLAFPLLRSDMISIALPKVMAITNSKYQSTQNLEEFNARAYELVFNLLSSTV
jgi:hypothetical protein